MTAEDIARRPQAEGHMADEKPKPDHLKVVVEGEHNPNSVFDDLGALRKASKLTVQRKTIMVNVLVDKPANNSYFRVHPDWKLDGASVIRDVEGSSRTFYFVVPAMCVHPKLAPRLRRVTLALVYTWPADALMIWPVPILGERDFKAWKSARAAYDLAQRQWTQIAWDETRADYLIEVAEKINHEPTWSDKSFEELLKLAFDGKVIDNADHPYVRRLRGIID
jgi:hypothetical protein